MYGLRGIFIFQLKEETSPQMIIKSLFYALLLDGC